MPHPAKYAFWYGLCFMTIVLTRMIDAAVICAVVFAALVMLLKDKQYKVLFQNMGTFLLGCAVSIVPVLIWGIANNCYMTFFTILLFLLFCMRRTRQRHSDGRSCFCYYLFLQQCFAGKN